MQKRWTRLLIVWSAGALSALTGFIVFMYFHHDPHWTPHRFGGFYVALACIPVCLASYNTSIIVFLFHKGLILFPGFRNGGPISSSNPR